MSHRYVTAFVGFAGVGVIAVAPITTPRPDGHAPDIQLTAGEESIVIDFVRLNDIVAALSGSSDAGDAGTTLSDAFASLI